MNENNICEMSGCAVTMESSVGDSLIYGNTIGRYIRCCAECHEEYTDLDAYGRPDYAYQWLAKTQKELLDLE